MQNNGFTNKATQNFFRANESHLDKLAESLRVTSHSRFSSKVLQLAKFLPTCFPKASKEIDWQQVAELAMEG